MEASFIYGRSMQRRNPIPVQDVPFGQSDDDSSDYLVARVYLTEQIIVKNVVKVLAELVHAPERVGILV